MRLTPLAFFSSLIVAAAAAHLSGKDASSSSKAMLLTREVVFPSVSIAGLSLERRTEELVEEVDVELDDDDVSSEGGLETRGGKHKKGKAHHRSPKHSGRRSGHKKKQQHHKQPPSSKRPTHVKTVATSGGKFNGKGTFFRPDQGACGAWNTVNDKIVALSADIYQGGKHCFSSVRICHGSKCANAKVADLCPGCHHTSLDMSPSLFKELANPDVGVIDIQWSFV